MERSLMDIFSDYSPRLMGNGQIRMECPFRENHSDGSGRMSFFVTPRINAYHCFSCNVHGNLVKLLTSRFKVPYFEAVEMVNLTDYTPEHDDFGLDIIWDLNILPRQFLDRGYTKECLKHFRVGTTDTGAIIIPYYKDFNLPCELVGYQQRYYNGDIRRVRNSIGFDKKSYLYNLDYNYDYTVLVEGQSDVWRLYQYGYNACALMGATISDEQVKMLSKFNTVYLALDNDEAGRRAIEACNHRLSHVVNIMLVPYSTKDPGECEKESWDCAFKNSTDYIVYSTEMSMGWDGYILMKDDVLNSIR